LIYDIELSSLYCLLQIFPIYIRFLLYPALQFECHWTLFLLVFLKLLLLRFIIPLTGEWNGSDELASAGGYTSHWISQPPLGKVIGVGADFPRIVNTTIPD